MVNEWLWIRLQYELWNRATIQLMWNNICTQVCSVCALLINDSNSFILLFRSSDKNDCLSFSCSHFIYVQNAVDENGYEKNTERSS